MRKVLIGCGIVAGLVVVVMIVSGIVLSSWLKSRLPDTDRVEKLQAELRERYGEPDRFTPPLDGRLPADRLACFVAVRESLVTRRKPAAAGLTRFVGRARRHQTAQPSAVAKISRVIDLAQGGTEMVGGVIDYFGARAQQLLDAGMGEGEYLYYYCLTSFSWLGWAPLEQPEVAQMMRDLGTHGDLDDMRRELFATYEHQLRNLRDGLEAKSDRSAAEEATLKKVAAALDGGKAVPFAGAFPPEWASALEPYRARLEAALPVEPTAIVLDVIQPKPQGFHVDWEGKHSRRER